MDCVNEAAGKQFPTLGRRKFNLLIAKLGAYGFDTQTLYYIESYLDNRKQRVRVNSNFSSSKKNYCWGTARLHFRATFI